MFGDAGKKESDIRKYLATTRTDKAASWDKTKSPEEIAKVVRFLVSDESGPLSGAAVPVYGRA